MTIKVFNSQEKINMTRNQERAVTEAFDKWGGRSQVRVSKRSTLGAKFVPEFCCNHEWQMLNIDEPETKKFLQTKFDEQELGDHAKVCTKCKAFSLWENGKLWAYDSIVIEEEQEIRPPKRSGRR